MSNDARSDYSQLSALVAGAARFVAQDAHSICDLARATERSARQSKAQLTDDIVSGLQKTFRTLVQCGQLIREEKNQLARRPQMDDPKPTDRL